MTEIFGAVFDFLASIQIPLIGTEFEISVAQIIVSVCVTYIIFWIIVSFFNR